MCKALASLKLFAFFMSLLIVTPLQILALLITRKDGAYILPSLWHRIMCSIFYIRYTVQGTPFTGGQVLYMSNHISYLDISLLGGILRTSFLAKSEVANWPLFGFLARLQKTQFIERKRTAITKAKDNLAVLMNDGHSFIIFPEGTSTDGREVVPFKSSLFALALNAPNRAAYIQPITIRLDRVDGHSVKTQEDRDLYCWHRDMETSLAVHLWRFAKTLGAELTVIFHAPIEAATFKDRKILAKTCHETVSKGLKIQKAA